MCVHMHIQDGVVVFLLLVPTFTVRSVFSPSLPCRYHDMDSVLDFLILETLYKISIQTKWEVGNRFRSLIDGKYWYGSITERKAFR